MTEPMYLGPIPGTPSELITDLRYCDDKSTRDRAWEAWHHANPKLRAAFPPAMQDVIDEGYARRLERGDVKAASLFARLVAYRLNPTGHTNSYGWLTKPPGSNNVDGYSVDAIVANADPSDTFNVYDLVSSAESPGAHPTWNGPVTRRESDKWERPKPLTSEQLYYLLSDDDEEDGGDPDSELDAAYQTLQEFVRAYDSYDLMPSIALPPITFRQVLDYLRTTRNACSLLLERKDR